MIDLAEVVADDVLERGIDPLVFMWSLNQVLLGRREVQPGRISISLPNHQAFGRQFAKEWRRAHRRAPKRMTEQARAFGVRVSEACADLRISTLTAAKIRDALAALNIIGVDGLDLSQAALNRYGQAKPWRWGPRVGASFARLRRRLEEDANEQRGAA